MVNDPMTAIAVTINELRTAVEKARAGEREVRQAQERANMLNRACDKLRGQINELVEAAADPPTMVVHSEPTAGLLGGSCRK